MQKNDVVKKTVLVALVIFIFITIVLSIIAFINWTWVLGWVYGSIMALAGYFLGILLIFVFSKKAKTKVSGFWLSWARVWIQMVFHALGLIILIGIDNAVNKHSFFGGNLPDLLKPINVITYIMGIGLMVISTLVAHIPFKKGGKHERVCR